jgi:hypothetical protein
MNTELKEKMQKAAIFKFGWCDERYKDFAKSDFMEGAEAMYDELAPIVEWVSVDERLPEKGDVVLIMNSIGMICDGRLRNKKRWEIKYSDRDGSIYWTEVQSITHWRRIDL